MSERVTGAPNLADKLRNTHLLDADTRHTGTFYRSADIEAENPAPEKVWGISWEGTEEHAGTIYNLNVGEASIEVEEDVYRTDLDVVLREYTPPTFGIAAEEHYYHLAFNGDNPPEVKTGLAWRRDVNSVDSSGAGWPEIPLGMDDQQIIGRVDEIVESIPGKTITRIG